MQDTHHEDMSSNVFLKPIVFWVHPVGILWFAVISNCFVQFTQQMRTKIWIFRKRYGNYIFFMIKKTF